MLVRAHVCLQIPRRDRRLSFVSSRSSLSSLHSDSHQSVTENIRANGKRYYTREPWESPLVPHRAYASTGPRHVYGPTRGDTRSYDARDYYNGLTFNDALGRQLSRYREHHARENTGLVTTTSEMDNSEIGGGGGQKTQQGTNRRQDAVARVKRDRLTLSSSNITPAPMSNTSVPHGVSPCGILLLAISEFLDWVNFSYRSLFFYRIIEQDEPLSVGIIYGTNPALPPNLGTRIMKERGLPFPLYDLQAIPFKTCTGTSFLISLLSAACNVSLPHSRIRLGWMDQDSLRFRPYRRLAPHIGRRNHRRCLDWTEKCHTSESRLANRGYLLDSGGRDFVHVNRKGDNVYFALCYGTKNV